MDLFLNQEVRYNDDTFIISAFCNNKKELFMKNDICDIYWALLYNKNTKNQIIVNCNLIHPIIDDFNEDEFEDIIDSII